MAIFKLFVRQTIHSGSGLALAASLALAAQAACAVDPAEPSLARRQELAHLIRHDCGACHGLRLTGGLGPALDPSSLRGKPPENLTRIILDGRPGTAMPGWRTFLSEREARWLTEALMRGLDSEETQERSTRTRRHEEVQNQEPE
ncbi:MAG TPA: cytochrome c [Burkholderiales bacterium]|nr:cytochrome c [Burkholderiales bacterium]